MHVIHNITTFYHYVNEEIADPRTKGFPLTHNPLPIFVILFLYRQFVLHWGPAFMKNREPFNLKPIIIVYNIFQVCTSVFLAWDTFITVYWSRHYSIRCQKLIEGFGPIELHIANRVWCYYLIKLLDLSDTIFFVFRKKFSNITFLHIYHHMGMVVIGYFATKYVPGGHGIMVGFINTIIHSFMYTYYLIALVKPAWVQERWKKLITQMQILQFIIVIIHLGQTLFDSTCEYPKWMILAFLPHNVMILIMFLDFYVKTYIKKKTT